MILTALTTRQTVQPSGIEPQVTSRTLAFCAVPWARSAFDAGTPVTQVWQNYYRLAFELARQAAAQEDFRLRAKAASLN